MSSAFTGPIFLAALSVLVTVAALGWAISKGQGSSLSRGWLVFAALPGLIALLGFYSLAFHMHSSLGAWPDFYGTEGLPQALVTHHNLSSWAFTVALLIALGMPLVLALCALVPRLRSHMIYPSFCGAACWLCLFLTALSPAGFQNWWWD